MRLDLNAYFSPGVLAGDKTLLTSSCLLTDIVNFNVYQKNLI